MVKLVSSNECDHNACVGMVPVPKGYYGGYLCVCPCHDAKRAEDKAERDLREISQKVCPFCHTNFDYQTRCCAKLACVYNRLVALKDHYAKLGLEYRVVEIEKILEGIVK